MAPEKCRAFNFDKQTSDCDLLYVDGKTTLRPAVHSGIDLYDLHCLDRKKHSGNSLSSVCICTDRLKFTAEKHNINGLEREER